MLQRNEGQEYKYWNKTNLGFSGEHKRRSPETDGVEMVYEGAHIWRGGLGGRLHVFQYFTQLKEREGLHFNLPVHS